MRRILGALVVVVVAAAREARGAVLTPQTPVITEPATDGQTVNPYDTHMVTGAFVGAPGESHVCSDWEIRTPFSAQTVWSAPCVTGALRVHIHLGDGTFSGPLAGRRQLDSDAYYKLRVRFRGDAGPPEAQWSEWAERLFHTAPATAIGSLHLSDVSPVPSPSWRDESSRDVILPFALPSPQLRLEASGGTVLSFTARDGSVNDVSNPPALPDHGPLKVVCDAGGAALSLPASRVAFADGSGTDRLLSLPEMALAAGSTAAFWISEAGEAFAAAAADTSPDFSMQVSAAPVPWAVKQPGFRIERVATGLQLPVNIAFLPAPGPAADDPFFYVTELYGKIKVVTRAGQVSDYATDLLNFDPTGNFPGSGEKGLAGIVVDPASGDVFASAVEAIPGQTDFHFPRVLRLHSADGGRSEQNRTTILDFPTEPLAASHQISNVSIGPDGKLYVHIGDGLLTTPAEDLNSVRGKILRVNFDGSAPTDNPFFNAADGLTATDLVFAYGFRNPFGGAWREADGAHYEVENGPSTDRLAKVVAGRNYLWDGSDPSMRNFAAYNWSPAVAPVNIAFVQPSTFGGSGFPADRMDHAFVTESGATYAPGPQANGKRISEFVLDADGNLASGPVPLIEYVGAGRATATALAAGPDGLYFADLYKDFGAASPIEPGANVFRIRYTGVADFSADVASGTAPLTVTFHDESDVPAARAWHWQFGDGGESDERDPTHEYRYSGSFDVRLTVTGAGGEAVRQRAALVTVAPGERRAPCCPPPRPQPFSLPPR